MLNYHKTLRTISKHFTAFFHNIRVEIVAILHTEVLHLKAKFIWFHIILIRPQIHTIRHRIRLTNRKQVDIYGFWQHDTVKEFGDEWSTVRSHTVQYSKTNERIDHSLNNTETVILIFSMVFHTSKTIKMFVRHILTSWSYPQYSCFSKFYPTLGRLWRASIQVLIPKKSEF